MNIGRLGSKKVKAGVAVILLLAVGGAYLTLTPTEISNAEELQNMKNDLDGDYVLVDDIDASGIENFEPIGGGTGRKAFTGTFEGNGHTISNLTIDRPGTRDVGLFGRAEGGTVKNVSLEDVDVTGGDYVGGLVGWNWGGHVTNSYVTGEVSGGIVVGGLIGMSKVGHESSSRIHSSGANVTVTGDVSGGLIGYMGGHRVTNSYSTGYVTGNASAGGLIGHNSGASVTNSYATGEVSGYENAGGLVGTNTNTVLESYATGNVTGHENVGGLVGEVAEDYSDVSQSYAVGKVKGNVSVGGLVGRVSGGEIERSYATGEVTGNENVRGLVGWNSGKVSDSYWDVNTTGQNESVGGTGLTTEEMMGDAARENMMDRSYFIDENVATPDWWRTVTNPDDYPRLAWQTEEDE